MRAGFALSGRWSVADSLYVWLARHCAFQLGVFVAMLVAIIQLTFNRVNLLLLIREGFAPVVDEYWLAPVAGQICLGLRDLAIEIEPALLQLAGSPFPEWRIGG